MSEAGSDIVEDQRRPRAHGPRDHGREPADPARPAGQRPANGRDRAGRGRARSRSPNRPLRPFVAHAENIAAAFQGVADAARDWPGNEDDEVDLGGNFNIRNAFRRLHERFDDLDERFDGLERKIDVGNHNGRAFAMNRDAAAHQAARALDAELWAFKSPTTGNIIPLEEAHRARVRPGFFPATVTQAHAIGRDAVVSLRQLLELAVNDRATPAMQKAEKAELLRVIGV